METQEEIWKEIPGFEGRYEISTFGRARSVSRHCPGRQWPCQGRILKHGFRGGRKEKYPWLTLKGTNFRTSQSIHRLVALTFIPNPENKPEVNHKDGNKLNNNKENLEWCTRKENVVHSSQNGLLRHNGAHFNAKLSFNEVKQIKIKLSKGVRQCSLVKEYNTNSSTIHNISKSKSWKHVIT